MGKAYSIFHEQRHKNAQWAYEKKLNLIGPQGWQIKATKEIPLQTHYGGLWSKW